MNLTIQYLVSRPANYEELEQDLNDKLAIGFKQFPEAIVSANWNGSDWEVSSIPPDFWYLCAGDMNKKDQK